MDSVRELRDWLRERMFDRSVSDWERHEAASALSALNEMLQAKRLGCFDAAERARNRTVAHG